MSWILPGVPTTTWVPPDLSYLMSSLTTVPPTQACTLTFMYSPMEWTTKAICMESSRVGETMRACKWSEVELLGSVSMDWRTPMVKAPVLPVPDWA